MFSQCLHICGKGDMLYYKRLSSFSTVERDPYGDHLLHTVIRMDTKYDRLQ